MKLVIAEKPSVAQSLARVIGATKRQDGYLEGPCRSSGPASRADRSGAETGVISCRTEILHSFTERIHRS